ncbi:ice-binding family protein [Pontibacter russatus]|uniref:ice-binding family protein n=1 Tax=Pontibacter russatus TaxID=2694929 RepID=UPI00137942AB|nr:ice-binding family protein [Pontibacter russatus]
MIRTLLLSYLFLAASVTLSFAQSDPILGRATSFGVLAATQINNNPNEITGIEGNVGIHAGSTIIGEEYLFISGRKEIGNEFAAEAQQHARAAFDNLSGKAATGPLSLPLGGRQVVNPGVYKINGDAALNGSLVLDGKGDPNALFIFVIDGNFAVSPPTVPNPTPSVSTTNAAEAKNVYWVVSKHVTLGASTAFLGNIIAQNDITLNRGASINGRAISLAGAVNLDFNIIYLPVTIESDLTVVKVADDAAPTVGAEVTYTITATNNGPGGAFGVEVKEKLPAGLTFVSATPERGTYDAAANIWTIGEMANQESLTLTLVFRVTAAGQITNGVDIGGDNPDPNPDDNSDEDPIVVPVESYDLSVTKAVSDGPYFVGDVVTYTIVASNAGPYAAGNVIVTEQLPAGLVYISSTVTQGVFDPVTGIYQVGDLAKGATATLTVVARIEKSGTIRNIAVISQPDGSDGGNGETPGENPGENPNKDTNPDNDEDTVIIPVSCPTLAITLTGQASLCISSQNITYTATPVIGATYVFTLPDGWTLVSQQQNTVVVNAGTSILPGVIGVAVESQCGTKASASLAVQLTGAPAKPTITGGTASVCANGGTYTYAATGLGDDATYEWGVTGGVAIVSGQGTATVTVTVPENSLGGTLTVRAKNSCALFGEAATKVITVAPKPAAPVAIIGSSDVCAGSQTTYTVAEVTGATAGYTWTLPTGWTIVSGENTRSITVKAGNAGGTIAVSGSNSCGAGAATSLQVSVSAKPAKPTITGNTSSCVGTTLAFSTAQVAGATSYTWAVPAGWTIKSGQGTPTISVEAGSGSGNVALTVTNKCGDGEAATLAVKGTTAPAAPASITGNSAVCADSENLTYTFANPEAGAEYTWEVPAGWSIVSGQGTATIQVKAGTAGGTISVKGTNGCGTGSATTLAVTISEPPLMPATIHDNSSVCDGLTYSVDAVPGVTGYTWTVPAGFTITAGQGTSTIKVKAESTTATGQVTVVALNGTCGSLAASASIDISLADGQLSFPKAFSPNGDGNNDTWVIRNLDKFTNSEVTIFNRWGSEVYKTKNYGNDWSGNSLEQGTYFYKARVTVCEGVVKEFTGYVTLFR